MKAIQFLIFYLCLFSSNSFAQDLEEIMKAISIIESLSYEEYYVGEKCYNQTKITYSEVNKLLIIEDENYVGKDFKIKRKYSVFLNDIDLNSMIVDYQEISTGKYAIKILIRTKDNTIEEYVVETDNSKSPYPKSTSDYTNKLYFSANSKLLSKPLIEKYIQNIQVLLGVNKFKKDKLL